MWYNVWERRRGRKTNMERVLEEKEKGRKLTEWERREELVGENETSKEEGGATSIEQYWDELERVLETIGMDEIWKEENEPREEGEKAERNEERARKKIKIDGEIGEKETVEYVRGEKENPKERGDKGGIKEKTIYDVVNGQEMESKRIGGEQ